MNPVLTRKQIYTFVTQIFSVNVLATEMLLLPAKFPFTSLMQLLSGGVMLYLCFVHCQETVILLR